MFDRRDMVMMGLAAVFGFAGGAIFTRTQRVSAVGPVTVQATRFELVDRSGRVLAFWGLDDWRDVILAFGATRQEALASFGVGSDQAPFLNFTGKDGSTRVDLRFWQGRPFLRLGDEKWQGRVVLGFIAGDAPSLEDETWGVAVGAPLATRTLAGIGYHKDPSDGTLGASILLKDSKGKTWRAP